MFGSGFFLLLLENDLNSLVTEVVVCIHMRIDITCVGDISIQFCVFWNFMDEHS